MLRRPFAGLCPRLAGRASDELLDLLAENPVPLADLGSFSQHLRPTAQLKISGRIAAAFGLWDLRGPALLQRLAQQLDEQGVQTLMRAVPGIEPVPRGSARWVPVLPAVSASPSGHHAGAPRRSRRSNVPAAEWRFLRQGRLGDCWLIAVLIACEIRSPGFARSRIEELSNGLISVRLHIPEPTDVIVTPRVPLCSRAGDHRLRPNAASLIEKAAAVGFGRGSYYRLQFNFAGTAFRLLTGSSAPARPVPFTLETLAGWIDQGRPIVASTLIGRRPRRISPSGSMPGQCVLAGHVYAVVAVENRPAPGAADRDEVPVVRLRNPLGGPEANPRMRDLLLTGEQFRRAFLSVNVGPALPSQASATGVTP